MREAETPLLALLQHRIRDDGPMSVADYMALCLTHPQYGYYTTRDPLGQAGDFVTAPEISQMFGEMIGLWCVNSWHAMGSPDAFQLIEFGPGRGTLMVDALRAARVSPDFLSAVSIVLLESSPVLRRIQSEALAPYGGKFTHIDSFAATPAGPSLIIANEFFDALPIAQYVRTPEGWRQRLVGLDSDGALTWVLAASPVDAHTLGLADTDDGRGAAGIGDIVEISPQSTKLVKDMAQRFASDPGAALIIDYGALSAGTGDTLQAVAGHKSVGVFDNPGDADLTAHVRFDRLLAAAKTAGARIHVATTQRNFLRHLGINLRTRTLSAQKSAKVRWRLVADYRRLTGKAEMGDLFKVLAFSSPDLDLPLEHRAINLQQ